jgi:hypothetical protein
VSERSAPRGNFAVTVWWRLPIRTARLHAIAMLPDPIEVRNRSGCAAALPLTRRQYRDQSSRLQVIRKLIFLDMLFALLVGSAYVMLGITLDNRSSNSTFEHVIGSCVVWTLLGYMMIYLDRQVCGSPMSARLVMGLFTCILLLVSFITDITVFWR